MRIRITSYAMYYNIYKYTILYRIWQYVIYDDDLLCEYIFFRIAWHWIWVYIYANRMEAYCLALSQCVSGEMCEFRPSFQEANIRKITKEKRIVSQPVECMRMMQILQISATAQVFVLHIIIVHLNNNISLIWNAFPFIHNMVAFCSRNMCVLYCIESVLAL